MVATKIKERPFFPSYDCSGNIVAYFNPNSNSLSQIKYDIFGNIIFCNEDLPDAISHRFSTKMLINRLYYFGRRFLNSREGRWLTRDPMGESEGKNLFCFVGNTPLERVDPIGLKCTLVSGPRIGSPGYWQIAKIELDVTSYDGIAHFDRITITWNMNGEVTCCCNSETVVKKVSIKVKTSPVNFTEEGIPVIAWDPKTLTSGTLPNPTDSAGRAISELLAALLQKGLSDFAMLNMDAENLRNLKQSFKLALPKSGPVWPADPCN